MKTRPTRTSIALSASAALLNFLRSEQGQAQLRRVPQLVGWVRQQRGRRFPGRTVIDTTGRAAHEPPTAGSRATPNELPAGATSPATGRPRQVDRFGRRGLERRVAGLRTGFSIAFAEGSAPRERADAAVAEIERSLAVAAALPTVKRQRLQWRINHQIDELESALIDAASPRS